MNSGVEIPGKIIISKRIFAWVAAYLGPLALIGCGPATVDGLPREGVSGKVTLDGAPLAQGTIAFSPTKDSPTPGMVAIYGGSYSIPGAHGLVPGSYQVSILSVENSGPAESPDEIPGAAAQRQADAADARHRAAARSGGAAPPPNRIPSRYNTATTLAVEVKAGASNSFDFDLDSAAKPKK